MVKRKSVSLLFCHTTYANISYGIGCDLFLLLMYYFVYCYLMLVVLCSCAVRVIVEPAH